MPMMDSQFTTLTIQIAILFLTLAAAAIVYRGSIGSAARKSKAANAPTVIPKDSCYITPSFSELNMLCTDALKARSAERANSPDAFLSASEDITRYVLSSNEWKPITVIRTNTALFSIKETADKSVSDKLKRIMTVAAALQERAIPKELYLMDETTGMTYAVVHALSKRLSITDLLTVGKRDYSVVPANPEWLKHVYTISLEYRSLNGDNFVVFGANVLTKLINNRYNVALNNKNESSINDEYIKILVTICLLYIGQDVPTIYVPDDRANLTAMYAEYCQYRRQHLHEGGHISEPVFTVVK